MKRQLVVTEIDLLKYGIKAHVEDIPLIYVLNYVKTQLLVVHQTKQSKYGIY